MFPVSRKDIQKRDGGYYIATGKYLQQHFPLIYKRNKAFGHPFQHERQVHTVLSGRLRNSRVADLNYFVKLNIQSSLVIKQLRERIKLLEEQSTWFKSKLKTQKYTDEAVLSELKKFRPDVKDFKPHLRTLKKLRGDMSMEDFKQINYETLYKKVTEMYSNRNTRKNVFSHAGIVFRAGI